MWITILKRLGYGMGWIWVISMLAFFLSRQIPGDEILDYLSIEQNAYTVTLDPAAERILYAQVAKRRGLDLPAFYFSVQKGYYPDSLFAITPQADRDVLQQWIEQTHQGDAAKHLYSQLRNLLQAICPAPGTHSTISPTCALANQLLQTSDIDKVASILDQHYPPADSTQFTAFNAIKKALDTLTARKSTGLADFIPSLHWHGTRNQYHQWITGLLAHKPLTSLTDGRDAWTKIGEALRWTLIINIVAFLLALTLGCLIGIWSSLHDKRWTERLVNVLLFAAFAIPSFWLATLLILLFSSGEWMAVLPSGGLGPYHRADTWLEKWSIIARHLILPITCLTIGSLAYVSRQMKQSVLHELQQPYVQALRAMGISEKSIMRKHVIRNALFPIITITGQSLPALLSGSLIIEVIFSIPGMGRLLYTSILARDWPVAFPVLMLAAAVTVIIYILMDVVYQWIDPRVKTTG